MQAFHPVNMKEILTHLPTYTEKEDQVAFLLGGIGTGNVSIGARGQLMDWELFNKPGKGNRMPYSMFALYTQWQGNMTRAFWRRRFSRPMPQHGETCAIRRACRVCSIADCAGNIHFVW